MLLRVRYKGRYVIEGKFNAVQLMLLNQIFLFSMFFTLVFGNTFINNVNRNKA